MPRTREQGTRNPNGASTIYPGKDGYWHGRVTVGVLDNGKPDRRHVQAKGEAEVIRKVRKLERDRDTGKVRKPGNEWTVEKWLLHWYEHIAAPSVRYKTQTYYRTAIDKYLLPGIGAHRLERLESEHIERLYARLRKEGAKSSTLLQVHRAGVREARLHDARHTAATMLLVLNVSDRTVMDLMGWSKIDMAQRYMHVPDELRRRIAAQVDGLLWTQPKGDDEDRPTGTPVPA